MENPNPTIKADNSNVTYQHVHKLDATALVLFFVLILTVAYAGYMFGKAADADVEKSRQVATLRNHVNDLEAEMKTIQNYEAFHQFLEERRAEK